MSNLIIIIPLSKGDSDMRYDNLISIGLLQYEDISSCAEKSFIVDDIFSLLKNAYKDVKGGLHFVSKDDLISSTSLWKVIYFDENIVGVVIYKAKQGLKMVALGIAKISDREIKHSIKTMLSFIFKQTFSNTWMEVSEGVEQFIIKNGGERFLIHNTLAKKLTSKNIISLDDDGYHYTRNINGIVKRKVMIGTVKFRKISI